MRDYAAPGPGRLHQRLGADPARQAAADPPHRADGLWRAGLPGCRAGIAATDLFAARHLLAAACWAKEVRGVLSGSHAHLVTLEIYKQNS